eukprot:10253102-Prorocentrum_lima.AAC.1
MKDASVHARCSDGACTIDTDSDKAEDAVMDKRTLRLKTRLKEEELPALEALMSDSAIQFGDLSSDRTSNQGKDVCAR